MRVERQEARGKPPALTCISHQGWEWGGVLARPYWGDGGGGWRWAARGGTLLTALLPVLQGTAGSVDVGALLGQAVGGGIAGAVVTAIAGLVKSAMVGQAAR